jgi:hypothetical protein
MAKETLSEAIRKALEVLGVDAKAKEVRDYINREYPALKDKTDTKTFSSTLSVQRKKMRDEGTGDLANFHPKATTARPEATATLSAANGSSDGLEAVLSALLDVKRTVGKIGKEGVRRLLDEAL